MKRSKNLPVWSVAFGRSDLHVHIPDVEMCWGQILLLDSVYCYGQLEYLLYEHVLLVSTSSLINKEMLHLLCVVLETPSRIPLQ